MGQLGHLWKDLAEYNKFSSSGTFRNRNFGAKHLFLSNNAFLKQKLKNSVKKRAQLLCYETFIKNTQ